MLGAQGWEERAWPGSASPRRGCRVVFLGARRSQERKAQRCENEQHARPVAGAQAEVMRAAGKLSGRGPMAGSPAGVRPVGRERLLWSDVRFSKALAE